MTEKINQWTTIKLKGKKKPIKLAGHAFVNTNQSYTTDYPRVAEKQPIANECGIIYELVTYNFDAKIEGGNAIIHRRTTLIPWHMIEEVIVEDGKIDLVYTKKRE